MTISLQSDDFQALVSLLQALPEFANVRDRQRLLEEVLTGTPRAATLLARLDLDGRPRGVAVGVVKELAGFGQVADGSEALALFLQGLLPDLGEEQAALVRRILDSYASGLPGRVPGQAQAPLPPGPERRLRHLRLVLASPGDVQPERDRMPGVLEELNRGLAADRGLFLELYRWETDSYPRFHPQGPQGGIDEVLGIEDCDLLVGLFWNRFGTPTQDAGSGTEHEIGTAVHAWRRSGRPEVMVYFKRQRCPDAGADPAVEEQCERVRRFQREFPAEGLWWPFVTRTEFEGLLRRHLGAWLRQQFALDHYSSS